MRILAIETSCDDTAVAIVENGSRVLVNLVASQEKLHAKFGGVVPEVASREHLKAIYPLIDLALEKTKLTIGKIDALAVTVGPGLLGSLLVGVNAARTLGYLWNKPVIPVNHLMGHVSAGLIGREKVVYPVVALVASGGHSEIVLSRNAKEYKYLGGTRDDAAGEAYDKVARLLQIGYPGGPAVDKLAMKAKVKQTKLPRPMLDWGGYDFSFSGLKTAVSRSKEKPAELAFGFQEAIVEVLTTKLFLAAQKFKAKTVLIGGGVAASGRLRGEVTKKAEQAGLIVVIPDREFCTDNAAMIGVAAYAAYDKHKTKWYNVVVNYAS